jgi:hypothetical protein
MSLPAMKLRFVGIEEDKSLLWKNPDLLCSKETLVPLKFKTMPVFFDYPGVVHHYLILTGWAVNL